MADLSSQSETRRSNRILPIFVSVTFLALIVGAAAYLRLIGLDWDENQHLHPDERFLTMVTSSLEPVKSIGEYFDTANSTLNPNNVGYGFFVYGDFPVIMARYVGQAIGRIDYFNVYLVGRVLSACADLGVLVLVFFIAVELFDWRIGLLAAGLYGAAALPIQLSHFYTVDTFTNLFVTASFLFVAREVKRHRWTDFILFGITFGLAVASKVSVFPLAFLLAVVVVIRTWNTWQSDTDSDSHGSSVAAIFAAQTVRSAFFGLLIAGVVTLVTFRVSQPYAFLLPNSGIAIDADKLGPLVTAESVIGDRIGLRLNPAWLDQMNEVRIQVSGYSDIPPNHQWGKRLPLIFPWVNMVRVGLGWPFGIFCWLAFAWSIWEIIRRDRKAPQLLPVTLWAGVYFLWQGTGWVTTMRYFLPVYPFLALLAGWALITLWDRIQSLLTARGASRWHWPARVAAGIAFGVILSAYAWGFAVSRIYTRPVTRVAASQWMLENIPSDLTLQIDTSGGPRQYQIGLLNDYPPAPLNPSDADPTHPFVSHSRIYGGASQSLPFTLPFSGTVRTVRINRALDASDSTVRTIQAAIALDPGGANVLAQGQVTEDFTPSVSPNGHGASIDVPPTNLSEGMQYFLILQVNPGPPLDLYSATIATEGDWDDPLPLSIAPYNIWGAQFQGYQLQMAWEDIPQKRDRMQYILDNTDYIVISSNRFYAALPRNPQRFPLTIAYYRALFSGDLGFDLVADFVSRPNLGPIQFYDDNAEEAWTVYDHPRVLIFKKSDRYSSSHTSEILNSVDLTKVVRVIAKDAQGTPVTLTLPTLKTQSPAVTPNSNSPPTFDVVVAQFYRDNQWLAVILWWTLISLIGWAAFPILYCVMPGLPDRAFPLSRAFGLILAAWAAWMGASLNVLPWTPWGIALVLVVLIAAGVVVAILRRHDIVDWVVSNRRHLLFIEGMTLILFIYFLLVRLGNPDLWHPSFGGEKPMDLAYFSAVLKSQSFPPYDPWFAGATINYYYFGFVIVGLPVKLLGIPPTIAYNLIVPTLFALTGIGAFSVAFNLISFRGLGSNSSLPETAPPHDDDGGNGLWVILKRWPHISLSELQSAWRQIGDKTVRKREWLAYAGGVAALLLTTVLGNLDQIRTLMWGVAELGAGKPAWANTPLPDLGDILKGLQMWLGQGQPLPIGLGEWYWNATRLIPVPVIDNAPTEIGPITEFPYFTFLYADLHAHMIAMPITLLALVWCVGQLGTGINFETSTRRIGLGRLLLSLFPGALIIGALRPTNTWDWPTYLLLGSGALLLAHFYRRGEAAAVKALAVGGICAAGLGGLGYVFFTSQGQSEPASGAYALVAAASGAGFGLLLGFALGLAIFPQHSHLEVENAGLIRPWVTLFGGLIQIMALAGLTVVLFLPYILNYKLAYTSFIPWEGSKTPLWAYLDILGLFLYIVISWMVVETIEWIRELRATHRLNRTHVLPILAAAGGLLVIISIAIANGFPVAAFGLPLVLWAVALFFRDAQSIEKRAVLMVLTLAVCLSMLVEVVVLEGDISRMNTVFKFYVQVWILLAVAAGAALGWLWPSLGKLHESLRTLWLGFLGVLVFLAALYPLLATRAKIADRWSPDAPHTLDGMAYMPYVDRFENGTSFSLKPDYEAIRWMQDHLGDTPILLEAHTVEYMWGNRISVYTGLPAVIGWNWHQRQQRPDRSDEVWARVGAVDEIYNTTSTDRALALLRQYNVNLIYVGDLERAYYGLVGLDKFRLLADEGKLTIIYDVDNTIIYQMPGNSQ